MYAWPAAIAGCMIYHGALTLLVILILLLVKALKQIFIFLFCLLFLYAEALVEVNAVCLGKE